MNGKTKHRPPKFLTREERRKLEYLTEKAFAERDFITGAIKAITGASILAFPGAAGVARGVGSRVIKQFTGKPTKLPEGFHKLLSSHRPKVVKFPESSMQKQWSSMAKRKRATDVRGTPNISDIEEAMGKIPYKEGTPDYDIFKALLEAKNNLGKLPPRGKNVVSFRAARERLKRPPKKARGGKIKKGYASGGGIRRPKQ